MEETKKNTRKQARKQTERPAGELAELKEYVLTADGHEYEVLERGSKYLFCKGAQFRYTNKDIVSIVKK